MPENIDIIDVPLKIRMLYAIKYLAGTTILSAIMTVLFFSIDAPANLFYVALIPITWGAIVSLRYLSTKRLIEVKTFTTEIEKNARIAYRKRAIIMIPIWFTPFLLMGAVGATQPKFWHENSALLLIIIGIGAVGAVGTVWFYAKSKGYSGFAGVGLLFLGPIGMLILLALKPIGCQPKYYQA